jgi:hypothetical protein
MTLNRSTDVITVELSLPGVSGKANGVPFGGDRRSASQTSSFLGRNRRAKPSLS